MWLEESMVWKNSLQWLKAYYDYELRGLSDLTDDPRKPVRVAARMFEVVEELGKKVLSWEEVEETLEIWHQVLAEDNSQWQ